MIGASLDFEVGDDGEPVEGLKWIKKG